MKNFIWQQWFFQKKLIGYEDPHGFKYKNGYKREGKKKERNQIKNISH